MAFSNYTPSPRPKNFGQTAQAPQTGENNSGQGPNTPVPDIVARKFNWGAFLLSWIWGLGNNTYITLLIFATILVAWIPIIGWLISLGVCIWFGTKGNEWAWQNKRFQSVEHFHEYQKKWAIAGGILYLVSIIIGIIINCFIFAYLFKSPAGNYGDVMKNADNNLSKYENVNTDLSKYEKYYEHEMKKLNADLEKMQKDYEEEKRDYSEPIKDAKDYQERIEKWQKDYEEEKRDYEKQLAEEKELMEKVDAMLKDIKEKQNN